MAARLAKLKNHSIIILNIFLCAFLFAQPENIRFEHLTVQDGLSDNRVQCIIQDSKGFMWFGTMNGLNKYDGYKFTIYKNDPNDSLSLANNYIMSLYEDHLGVLWIGTRGGGLCRYDRNRDAFIRYTRENGNPNSLCGNQIVCFFETEQHVLWIGTGNGLNKYNRETDNFSRYYPDENKSQLKRNVNYVSAITQDGSGRLWIGTWNEGLFYYDAKKDKLIKYIADPKYAKTFVNQFTDKLIASRLNGKDYLWFTSYQYGLYRINIANGEIRRYQHQPDNETSISDNRTWAICQTKKGNELWIGTESGLNRLDLQTEEFMHYRHQPGNSWSLNDNVVFSIFKDRSGLIWAGTSKGVDKFDPKTSNFNAILQLGDIPNYLSVNTVKAIHESNEGGKRSVLWIGTEDGLHRFDYKSGLFKSYKHTPEKINSLSDNAITKIIESQSGNKIILWVSTVNGLNRIDLKTKQIARYYIPTNDPVHNMIYSLCEDKNGMIWMGTQSSYLYSFDPESEQFTRYNTHRGPIFTLHLDSSGMLWIGAEGGLYKLNPATKEETYYHHISGDAKSINNDNIWHIFEDKEGILWIGTSGGLNKFDRSTETFTAFSEKDGLPNNVVKAILEDIQGNLWLSTNRGISKFNRKNRTFRNFYAADGLPVEEFFRGASHINHKGEMFFGGRNGLTYFHPDSIKDNSYLPPIILTDFQLFNESIKPGKNSLLKKQVSEVSEITLSHDQSIFSFEFAALEYRKPGKIRYAYMMENVDPDWVFTDATRRFVTYTQLDAGEYVFRAKASNADGIWNEQGTSVRITILPPWWKTWWAYSMYAVLILGTLYGLRRYELSRQRFKHQMELEHVEAEKLKEVDNMKSRFFANISHEFRTPLTLIFGPAKDTIDKTKDLEAKQNAEIIKRNADRLYGLVNQLLDISKLEAGRMKLETSEQNIIPLLKGVVLSFTSLAERKKITLQFNTNTDMINVFVDKEMVEKIITNLLSNAFKFTPEGGEITVFVSSGYAEFSSASYFSVKIPISTKSGRNDNAISISVNDTGIGIPTERLDKIFDRFYQVDGSYIREKEGTGIGLALTKELVELHKGKIKVESKEGEGTTFTVLLPLGKDHLKADEIMEKENDEGTTKIIDKTELIPETENRGIDSILDTDKPLLLIVEDNSDVRNYIISHLVEDYRIEEAINGEDGLNKSIKQIPDLIVSDVMMPKMDGFELCEKIKTDQRTSHIPIILLTAKATSKDKIEGYQTGADDYIMKPFDAAELKVRIKNLIEIRRKLQEKFSTDDYNIPKELSSMDEQFLKNVFSVINEHISEEEFNVAQLGKEVAISRKHLHRKLKALTGKSPSQFMRSLRLTKAKKLIKDKKGTISEISFLVGFSSPAYFNKCFKEEFGYTPGELIQ